MYAMTPTQSFQINLPGPATHRTQDFQFGPTQTPLMNQGFNLSVPLNTAEQQYQWNPDDSSYFSRNNLSPPPVSRGNSYMYNLAEGVQLPNAAENYQRSVPLYGTQLMGEG